MLLFTLFQSCSKTTVGRTLLRADLKNVTDVQLTYRQNIYNVKLSYNTGLLTVSFTDGSSCLCGVTYAVNSKVCKISYGDISKSVPIANLPNDFLPVLIYRFVSDFDGTVVTEDYNSRLNCSYVLRNIGKNSVTFEVYQNGGNTSYSLYIR